MAYLIASKPLSTKESSMFRTSIPSVPRKGGWGNRFLLPTPSIANYYSDLYELALLIANLCPEQGTHNPYKRLEDKVDLPGHLPKENIIKLYDVLLHAITLLNRHHRPLEMAKAISSREDVIAALALVRPIAFPNTMVKRTAKDLFKEVSLTFGQEDVFTSAQVAKELSIPQHKAKRYLTRLREAGWVKLVRTGKANTYYYRLGLP